MGMKNNNGRMREREKRIRNFLLTNFPQGPSSLIVL